MLLELFSVGIVTASILYFYQQITDYGHLKSYNLSYFETGRSSRIRSLLCVNEEFENKPDAKRATLDDFAYRSTGLISLIRNCVVTTPR